MKRLRILARELKQAASREGTIVAGCLLPQLLWRAVRYPGGQEIGELDAPGEAFDRRFDVDTCGVIRISHLAVSDRNWVYGFDYQAVEPFDMGALLEGLSIDYPASVFIDLGAGKGRVLMLASKLQFKQIIGVEISAQLAGIATRNLRIFRAREEHTPPVELVRLDAASYHFPADPLVIFLYNPFNVPVMQRVIDNLVESSLRAARRVVVIYFRPELAEMWDYAPGFSLIKSSARFRIYDNEPAGSANTGPGS